MQLNGINFSDTHDHKLSLKRWTILFYILNIFLIIALSQRYTISTDLPSTTQAWAYYITLTLGHFSFLIYFLYLLIALPVVIFFPYKHFTFTFNITILTFIISLIAIDTFVFSQYRFHISPFLIQMIIDAGDQVIGFSFTMWLTLFFGILLLLIFEYGLAILVWNYQEILQNFLKPKLLLTSLIALYLTSHFIHMYADANYDRSVTTLTRYYPLLNPATAKKFMIKQGWASQITDNDINTSTSKSDLLYPISPLTFEATKSPYNILYIVLDSWRFDAMTAEITPNIYRFSQNSLVYNNHYSGANDTRTGIFSLFYALPGNYWHSFESSQRGPVLIDTLLEHNYETAIYASAPLINPEFDRTVFKRLPHIDTTTEGKSAYDRDEKVIQKWLAYTDQKKSTNSNSPFFGFLFLDSIHAYQYPDNYPRRFTPTVSAMNYFTLNNTTDATPIKNFYNNISHYTDSLVGKVINNLKKNDMLKNTVVVITGDHGQELNDNKQNFWGHNSNFSDSQTRVPLIIHWPETTPKTINQASSHYDLTPTIIENIFKSKTDVSQYSVGRNLFTDNLKPLESIIMTNYSMISIYDFQQDVMMVKNYTGSVDYYNGLHQASDKKPSPLLIKNAINDMSRFYK